MLSPRAVPLACRFRNMSTSNDFSYDPVTALDESSATGATAEIFTDIRATLGIPLVTSIWRGLADMDDSLRMVWRAAKPVYESGLIEKALQRVVEQSGLPMPQPLVPNQLMCIGVDNAGLSAIRTILNAYNRSNGMNMLALAAVISPTASTRESAHSRTAPNWGHFPPLLSRDAIGESTWGMIRQVNAFGASGIDAHVATLWRHLGHWPSLLSLVHSAFAPLHAGGSIAAASARMVELTREEGERLAGWRDADVNIPDRAFAAVTGYVTTPTQVARMVTLGHALARWLHAP